MGILAYELLVGAAPFDDESRENVCVGILENEPVYPSGLPKLARRQVID